eukprot:7634491-Lingulodinium_polyedra.AAC.1
MPLSCRACCPASASVRVARGALPPPTSPALTRAPSLPVVGLSQPAAPPPLLGAEPPPAAASRGATRELGVASGRAWAARAPPPGSSLLS